MRFDADVDFPEIVKTVSYVAFEDKSVNIKPNSPSADEMLAFIEEGITAVDPMQIDC